MKQVFMVGLLLLMESIAHGEVCAIRVQNARFPISEACECTEFPAFCEIPLTPCDMNPKQCKSSKTTDDPFLFGLVGGFGGAATFPGGYQDNPPINPEDDGHETIPAPEPLVLIPVVLSGIALKIFRKRV